jgi:hypothetical protein
MGVIGSPDKFVKIDRLVWSGEFGFCAELLVGAHGITCVAEPYGAGIFD